MQVLQKVAEKNANYALFERTSKTVVGKDMTDSFDLSNLADVVKSTLGPRGKSGFTETFRTGRRGHARGRQAARDRPAQATEAPPTTADTVR